MNRRVGIFSGTFDPIHQGHIAFAKQALQDCKLDEVLLLPEQKPRSKHDVTDIKKRLLLIEREISAITGLRAITLESQQFTLKGTLPELRAITKEADCTFLLGSDVVRTFLYRWDDLGVLLSEFSLAIGMRTSDSPDEITSIIKKLENELGLHVRYRCIYTAHASLSSSQIRNIV